MKDLHPLLNPSGKAPLRTGYISVTTEREFLQKVLIEPRLMVCGPRLCQWARDFYRARDINAESLNNPEDDLLTLCPEMNTAWAEKLFSKVQAQYHTLARPLTAMSLLMSLHPSGPWQTVPSLDHAAEWLLWLSACPTDDVSEPLIRCQAALWSEDEDLAFFYQAETPEQATSFLRLWLGLDRRMQWKEAITFPLDVPLLWRQRADKAWRSRVVDQGLELFEELRAQSLPLPMLRLAADIVADYLEADPALLTASALSRLRGYIPTERFHGLEGRVAPALPDTLPNTISDVLRWFSEQYLPFRRWSVLRGDTEKQEQGDALAQEFSRWCLDFYPQALAGGEGAKHLALRQAERLRETRQEWVTLWVILDGLHSADASNLISWVEEEPRLSRIMDKVVVATLPTITVFSKKALIAGLPPDQMVSQPLFPTDMTPLSENKDPCERLEAASLGEIFVWQLLEPDKSYHKPQDRTTLLHNVAGELKTVAGRLKSAIKAVDSALPLRVILSTDHGRFLGASQRHHAVPSGLTSEGRASHGQLAAKPSFTSRGYQIDGEIAYLNKTVYRLPEDCAVVLGQGAFVANDGSHGTIEFPHGGLSPEEVLTPWVEFVRDTVLPTIEVQVLGQGVAGTTGNLTLSLKNPSNVALRLNRLTLYWGEAERSVALNGMLNGMTKEEISAELPDWPAKSQAVMAHGTLLLETLAGKQVEAQAQVALESNEMYSSAFDTDDLLNL